MVLKHQLPRLPIKYRLLWHIFWRPVMCLSRLMPELHSAGRVPSSLKNRYHAGAFKSAIMGKFKPGKLANETSQPFLRSVLSFQKKWKYILKYLQCVPLTDKPSLWHHKCFWKKKMIKSSNDECYRRSQWHSLLRRTLKAFPWAPWAGRRHKANISK